jgi:hypothetical protein
MGVREQPILRNGGQALADGIEDRMVMIRHDHEGQELDLPVGTDVSE